MKAQARGLSLSGLKVTLDGTQILRGVTLEVPAGSTVGLVGHNGAGKTTTLRAVMGLVRSRGRILLNGMAIDAMEPAERARLGIGYAPEDRRLITPLSVADNLRLPTEATGASRAETDRRFAAVLDLLPELAPLARRPAGLLSGGQQKIAALGRALMIGRRLLLLDEPFQGLAPAVARRYARALTALAGQGLETAILITESNPTLVAGLAERICTIERGVIAP